MRERLPAKTTPAGWQGGSTGIPELSFAAATLAGFAAWAVSSAHLPADLVMPVVASIFFAFAAAFALTAWLRRGADPSRVTYADVAGALTLIGVCAAATIEPEQMVSLVEAGSADSRR